ncbi:MAG: hypothetical protein FWC50_03960 [Planctomycetaceae bacterium]|nr:hypothetical protein [Planctomycetaceae bacterium]
MKSDRRRQKMAKNSLEQWLERLIKVIKPYGQVINLSILGLLLIVILWWGWGWLARKNVSDFMADVNAIAGNADALTPETMAAYLAKHPKGENNAYLNMLFGEIQLVRASAELETNRSDAIDLSKKALENFQAANAWNVKTLGTGDRIVWGLAMTHEMLAALQSGDDREQAVTLYEHLGREWPKSAYVNMAANDKFHLNRPVTKLFLTEYEKSDIGRKAPETAVPALPANFDPNLPAPGTEPSQTIFDPGLSPETVTPETTPKAEPTATPIMTPSAPPEAAGERVPTPATASPPETKASETKTPETTAEKPASGTPAETNPHQ